jgi:hypothetical protein
MPIHFLISTSVVVVDSKRKKKKKKYGVMLMIDTFEGLCQGNITLKFFNFLIGVGGKT